MKKQLTKLPVRPIREITKDIEADIAAGNWSRSASAYARPYLRAMKELGSVSDKYLLDSGRSVVLYFLSNASTWRGDVARKIKNELRSILA